MQKLVCLILLFFSIVSFVSAQSNPSDPIIFNSNVLVHSKELPNEFLLFSPDTVTQILFNPARGATYKKSFFYLTYLPKRDWYSNSSSYRLGGSFEYLPIDVTDYNNDYYYWSRSRDRNYRYSYFYGTPEPPTITLTSLFSVLDSKWLLTFSNVIKNNSVNNSSLLLNNSSYDSYRKTIVSDNYSLNEDLENWSTSFKLSNIGVLSIGNYSIGIFGIINRRKSIGNYSQLFSRNEISWYQNSRKFSSSKNDNWDTELSSFVIGTEFSLSNSNWDFIGTFSYKSSNSRGISFGTYTKNSIDSVFYSHTTPSQWKISSMKESAANENSTKLSPNTFYLSGFYQHRISLLTPKDNIVLSFNSFYSLGNIKLVKNINVLRSAINFDNIHSGDTLTHLYSDLLKSRNYGFNVSLGYVFQKKLFDIDIVTGVNIKYGYYKTKSVQNKISNLNYFTDKINYASLALPIYLNYSPRKWFSVFGGLNYVLYFSNLNSTSVFNDVNPNEYEINITDKSISKVKSNLTTLNDLYLGVDFKHRSGLVLQVLFGNALTAYKSWNISLGYHF